MYAALVLGVREYVAKNGFRGAVLGLSGGIDSALALCIAVDALGPAEVETVLMPSRYTAAMSVEDARAQADALGIAHRIIPIEPAVVALNACLSEVFAGWAADTTEENIQARCRGVILMAISNKTGRLVLTTGNKSEMAVGYATLYGDMAGGFAPLKDVTKTLVYRLARWRNARAPVIPERVFVRPPTAELASRKTRTTCRPTPCSTPSWSATWSGIRPPRTSLQPASIPKRWPGSYAWWTATNTNAARPPRASASAAEPSAVTDAIRSARGIERIEVPGAVTPPPARP